MTTRNKTLTVLACTAALAAVLATGCTDERIPPPSGDVAQETTQSAVYYSTGRSILAERKIVDATDVYGDTLAVLLKARPTTESNVAIVQPTAPVRSVALKDRVITVDWDKAILDFEATPEEQRLARASILLTFGQFPEVDKVRFTVEGKGSGTIGGKDIVKFWGGVTLKDQPWDVVRMQPKDATSTAPPAPGK